MNIIINVTDLRTSLPRLVERVRKGVRFTVLHRSRPAFQIVPVDETDAPRAPLASDSLYRASAVGRSTDGRTAAEHDESLYGR
jgi:prevent-host-death family protein